MNRPIVTDNSANKFVRTDTRNEPLEAYVTDNQCIKFNAQDTRNARDPRYYLYPVCQLCGAVIAPGVPLFIGKMRRPDDTFREWRIACADCRPSLKTHPVFYCKTCNRPVHYAKRTKMRVYCSPSCHYAALLVKPITKTCAICEKSFIPHRKDARTCSPACRQKAYRQRSKD